MMKTPQLIWLFASLLLCSRLPAQSHTDQDSARVWGADAVMIGPTYARAPVIKELLDSTNRILSLDRFYRIGGKNIPATPTECHITYSVDSLFVLFSCKEDNMSYPTKDHHSNWYRLSRSPVEQDAAFPDKVDLFIRPSFKSAIYYHLAITKDGRQFGNEHTSSADGGYSQFEKIRGFKSTVIRQKKGWIVFLRIPWNSIGGKPKGYFGVLPMRSRWRNGEVSSPAALDFTDRPPADLYIEARLGDRPKVFSSKDQLCRLPSGILRWRRSAYLSYPSSRVLKQIWKLQQSLQEPTNSRNIGVRIYLAQQWTDLLTLEGLNFGATTGSIVPENMFPAVIRENVNRALRDQNVDKACSLLNAYLHKLDKVSRQWFADGSPGDMLRGEWKPIERVARVEEGDSILKVDCIVANHIVTLHLALPATGGIRLWANKEGFFKPGRLLPLGIQKVQNEYLITQGSHKIVVSAKPFGISFYDDSEKLMMRIRSSDIAFHFDPKGKISGVDFKNPLHGDEVIYGFGEKYDRFNQRGNVLTLWGMDDWIGNTVGLHNESYKPIPIFHSSEGYMIFINSSYRLRADIGKAQPNQYRITQQGPVFDYYFWFCPAEKALRSYSDLTGKPILPPRWAFEPWMGRTGRAWAGAPLHNAVAEQERVVKRFEQLDIPHSAIYAEGSGADNPALCTFLAPRHIKVLSWYFSSISAKVQKRLMPEKTISELPILRFKDTIHSLAHSIDYVDFTNPAAKELARRWWKHRLDLGVAGSMVDFGDRVPEDALFYDGKRGDEMHNFYAHYYHKTYSEVFRERRGNDYILFARSAAPGDQQWVCQFAGDHASNYAGLQGSLNGLLNLSACGFSTWGSDLGGFRGWPEPALYIRWTQFGCFSPLMRCHGRTPREPWEYGQEALENYKHYAWVRENLLDYIYNEAIYAHKTGIPMVRSLAIACSAEKQLSDIHNQYFFGRDLLVAPVINEDTVRTVFFPPGRWTNLWDGKVNVGMDSANIKVPLNTIPVYLREGAIVPVALCNTLQFGQSMSHNEINALIITPPADHREKQLRNIRQTTAKVELQKHKNGFSTYLDNLPDVLYLIVYGANISRVKVNGEYLPLLKGQSKNALPPGWYVDTANRRVVIRLPCGVQKSIDILH